MWNLTAVRLLPSRDTPGDIGFRLRRRVFSFNSTEWNNAEKKWS